MSRDYTFSYCHKLGGLRNIYPATSSISNNFQREKHNRKSVSFDHYIFQCLYSFWLYASDYHIRYTRIFFSCRFYYEKLSGSFLLLAKGKGPKGHYKKKGYCDGPKPPLKVHLTYSRGCYCGGPSRQCCSATIGRLRQSQKAPL